MLGLLIFLGALIAGSFVTMLVWRIPNGVSLGGRSVCTHCLHTLAVIDLIPIVSFLCARGRCRYCAQPIARRYIAIEIASLALFLYVWMAKPQWFSTPLSALFVGLTLTVLMAIFVIDYTYQIIPDMIAVPSIIVLFIVQIERGVTISSLFFAALLASGFFAAQYAFSKGRWIGDGDIRLGVLMGVILGEWHLAVVGLLIAYMLGACGGLLLIGLGRAEWGSKTPFGTYLTVATFITLLYGNTIIAWYMHLWTRL